LPAGDEGRSRQWFSSLKEELESAYLRHNEPWKQSGFSGSEERWIACRKPVADCVDKSGSFLDIGCANGYLLECILKWTGERGLNIIPYGIDLSEKLVTLAWQRLPEYATNIVVGNGLYWKSPVRFDFVRTELGYVPENFQERYLKRIIDLYLSPRGKLLVAEYRSKCAPADEPWLDTKLWHWGFSADKQVSGYFDNRELTRISVVIK